MSLDNNHLPSSNDSMMRREMLRISGTAAIAVAGAGMSLQVGNTYSKEKDKKIRMVGNVCCTHSCFIYLIFWSVLLIS